MRNWGAVVVLFVCGVMASAQNPPQLALLSKTSHRSEGGDVLYVEGQVKNISDAPLRGVRAVVSWYSRDGTFIGADDGFTEYDPLLPNQTSPFKVMSTFNPEKVRFSVELKFSANESEGEDIVAAIAAIPPRLPVLAGELGAGTTKSVSAQNPPQLALLSKTGHQSEGGDFLVVEGQVKNISDAPLRKVCAVVSWYSSDGTFIGADDGFTEYDPLLPNQTSPFKVMAIFNPEKVRFSVEFKFSAGSRISMAGGPPPKASEPDPTTSPKNGEQKSQGAFGSELDPSATRAIDQVLEGARIVEMPAGKTLVEQNSWGDLDLPIFSGATTIFESPFDTDITGIRGVKRLVELTGTGDSDGLITAAGKRLRDLKERFGREVDPLRPVSQRFLVIAYQHAATKSWKVVAVTSKTDTAAEVENNRGFDRPDMYSLVLTPAARRHAFAVALFRDGKLRQSEQELGACLQMYGKEKASNYPSPLRELLSNDYKKNAQASVNNLISEINAIAGQGVR